jgi:DNA-binding CsgD family transcriptional regulator
MPNVAAGGQLGDGQLLELIGDVCGTLDLEELHHGLLAALHRVLPSDYVSLNDVGPSPEEIVTIMQPAVPELVSRWSQFAHENPLLRRYLRTLDGRAYRFSDVMSQEELRRLPLYHAVYAPLGVEYQIAFTLPATPDRVLAIALSRKRADYSDAERDFANRARPFLIQAYLNAIAYQAVRSHGMEPAKPLVERLVGEGLTRREAQVMRLVALGRSNSHIGGELGISARTVGKHLEHGFPKLGVADRSSAARRVWQLAGASEDGSAPAGQTTAAAARRLLSDRQGVPIEA